MPPTLPEIIETFCRSLGVRGWEWLPTKPLSLDVRFRCDVCRAKWTLNVEAGYASEETDARAQRIIREIVDSHDRHRCDLVLGAAGRTA